MENKKLAPIVLFVFKRPEHTRKALEALSNNYLANESVLYIYADAPKENADEETLRGVEETRQILKTKQWCKEVYINELRHNRGITQSIITVVGEILNQYGKIIVLEDDLVTSSFFLQYMNDALSLYQNEEKVMQVSSFIPSTTGANKLPDTFFLRNMGGWGWGTWKNAWLKYISDIDYLYDEIPKRKDFNHYTFEKASNHFTILEETHKGIIDTWDIQWYSSIFINYGLCLYPKYPLTQNIGWDGSGDRCGFDPKYDVTLFEERINVRPILLEESRYGFNYIKRFYLYGNKSSKFKIFRRKFKKSIRNLFKIK